MGSVEIQTARGGFLAGWTPETEALLAKYRQEGLSQTQIARRLGKSRTAINNKVARMGLPRFPSPIKKFHTFEEAVRAHDARPRRTDALAQLMRQATLPLPHPMPFAAPKTCQWPLWKDDERPGLHPRFCGLRAEAGRPYCCAHWQRAHTPRVWLP